MTPKVGDLLSARAARGEFDLIVPLDYKILGELQDEGTMLAGLYEIGTTVKEVSKKYPQITRGTVSGRLRSMLMQGLTKKVKLVGTKSSGASWQRTELGKKMWEEWKKNG